MVDDNGGFTSDVPAEVVDDLVHFLRKRRFGKPVEALRFRPMTVRSLLQLCSGF